MVDPSERGALVVEGEQELERRRLTPRRVLALGLEISLVGYIVYYLWQRREDLERVWALDLVDVGALVALTVAGDIIRSWEFQYLVRRLGASINYAEAFTLTQGGTLLNYAPFNAGTVLRARALRHHRELSYTSYVSLMSAQVLVTALAAGILGLAAIALAGDTIREGRTVFAVACALAIAGPVMAFRISPPMVGHGTWMWDRLRTLLDGWRQVGRHGSQLFLLVVLALVKLGLQSCRFWICFAALQMQVSLLAAVIFASVSSIMIIVNITPGAVGIRELLVAALGAFTGLSFAETMAAATIDRVVSLIVAVFLGAPSLGYLRRRRLL